MQARGLWDRRFCRTAGCIHTLVEERVSELGTLAFSVHRRVQGGAVGAPMGGFIMKTIRELEWSTFDGLCRRAGVDDEGVIALWNDLVEFHGIWQKFSEQENIEFDEEDWRALMAAVGVDVDEDGSVDG